MSIAPGNLTMKPDVNMAEKFLRALDLAGIFTFQTFDDKPGEKSSALAKVLHGTFAQHQVELARLNMAGAGIFVMVNEGDGIIHDGFTSCRCRINVKRVRMFFVDLDGSPIEPVLASMTPPNIVVESSPGKWHAYWYVDDCPLVAFKAAQAALATKFNGDPAVKDLPRVMRLPGFFHQKAEKVMSRLDTLRGVRT